MSRKRFTVSVYLIDRAYGGPEEGGWYFDCGQPSDEHGHLTRRFHNRKQASKYRHRLEAELDHENADRPDLHSVASRGVFAACIDIGDPRPWPEYRPHYC